MDHTNFGGWQWEPAGVVWHVDSYSLTPALFEERGLLDSWELQPSLLAQTEGSTVIVLWNPNWNGNGRQSGAGRVRFPLSEKFALLTFGNHTLAFHQGHLCKSLWIYKMHIFGLPQECFMGSFYVLCKVSIGPLVFQDDAPWVVSSSEGFFNTVPMLIGLFGYESEERKIKLMVAQNSSSPFFLVFSGQLAGITGQFSALAGAVLESALAKALLLQNCFAAFELLLAWHGLVLW